MYCLLQAIAIVGNTIGEKLSNRYLKLKIVPVRDHSDGALNHRTC